MRGGSTDSAVGDGKCVGITQCAHRDHLGGPRPNTGQLQQPAARALPIATGTEDHGAFRQCGHELNDAALPRLWEGQGGAIETGKPVDRREDVRQSTVRVGDRCAICLDETRGVRSSYGDRPGVQGEVWTLWAREAMKKWIAFDDEWGRNFRLNLFHTTGDEVALSTALSEATKASSGS